MEHPIRPGEVPRDFCLLLLKEKVSDNPNSASPNVENPKSVTGIKPGTAKPTALRT